MEKCCTSGAMIAFSKPEAVGYYNGLIGCELQAPLVLPPPSNEAAVGYEITAQTPQFCVSFFFFFLPVLLSCCLGQPRGSDCLERFSTHCCTRLFAGVFFHCCLIDENSGSGAIDQLADLRFICLTAAGTRPVKFMIVSE